MKTALYDEGFKEKAKRCTNPYGEGKAGIKIAELLNDITINRSLLQKKMVY